LFSTQTIEIIQNTCLLLSQSTALSCQLINDYECDEQVEQLNE